MTPDLHCLDILFSIWSQPLQRRSNFVGLAVVTQVFKEGHYLHSCQQIDAWVREKTANGVTTIREMARGPAGSFELLRAEYQDLFEQGDWFLGGLPDNLDSEPWLPPTECNHLVDQHGSFISVDYLYQWLSGLTP